MMSADARGSFSLTNLSVPDARPPLAVSGQPTHIASGCAAAYSGASAFGTKAVTKPWQMYVVGLLFGLGFDTATEVGLLVLAGGAAAFALPWYAIMTLPILFAAGMSLLDTVDGCFMNFAYGWAFSKPVRKIYYNITITGLSVAVALIIGSIELISIVTQKAGITSGPLAAIANVNLDFVGYAILTLFVLAWVVALMIWKYGRIEERWS